MSKITTFYSKNNKKGVKMFKNWEKRKKNKEKRKKKKRKKKKKKKRR